VKIARYLLVILLVVAGCGVPTQTAPVPIDREAIPSPLRDPTTPPPAAPSATPGRSSVQVNFVRTDKLVSRLREAPAPDSSDRLALVIQSLLAGPSDTEQAAGITTALPPDLGLRVVDVQGSRVILELSGETDGRSATENVLAVGQIVLSVTALPTIDQVSFSRDGAPVEALLADGALTTNPLTATDYEALRAP
jgi:spore germination protein GerM